MSNPSALRELLADLAKVDPAFAASVGAPAGPGWLRLDQVDSMRIGTWVGEIAERHGGHRDVAGSYLASWLARATTATPIASLVLHGVVPDLRQALWVHQHADGWFDAVSFTDDAPLVADQTVLVERLADDLVAVLGDPLESIRAVVRYGRAGLWGTVADELAALALHAARAARVDQAPAWELAASVCDAIGTRVPWLRSRPKPFPVQWSAGEAVWSVRCTCCLYFKTTSDSTPAADRYCSTCPLRDDGSRHALLSAHLERLGTT